MTQYVSVAVPEPHLPAILRHLAALLGDAPPSARVEPHAVEPQAVVPAQVEDQWTDEVWRKVWREVQPTTRAVLVALAERPGTVLTLADLAEAIGTETRRVQSALSSLTKRMKKHGPTQWPFVWVKDGRTGRFSYEMDEATASVVLRLAREKSGRGNV